MGQAMSVKLLALATLLPLAGAQTASIAPPRSAPLHPWVSECKDWDEWDESGPPFKVYGNTWYVVLPKYLRCSSPAPEVAC